jgi:steroid 5-alpha reductase family enzyme
MVVGDKPTWGALGYSGIALQVFGLLLESVADYQKSQYKAQEGQRNDWCHVGLWTFSTHPNYLGEMLFWLGTFLGGATSLYHDGNKWKLGLASVGLTFVVLVLRGAILSLDDKQVRKYGYNLDFVEFRKTHSVVGPIQFSKR